jgi:hypothetical protein
MRLRSIIMVAGTVLAIAAYRGALAADCDYEAKTINLARTSLAWVLASSVNGGRAMDNEYYGILNAFDDDKGNSNGGITYTHWLGSYNEEWVEVSFAEPVRVSSIAVDNGPRFSALLWLADGSQRPCGEAQGLLVLKEPADEVTKVRLRFDEVPRRPPGNEGVREIRVFGSVPIGVPYDVQLPRIIVDEHVAKLAAKERFGEWHQALIAGVEPNIEETEDSYRILYVRQADGLPVFRVVVDKETNRVQVEPLVDFAPCPGAE